MYGHFCHVQMRMHPSCFALYSIFGLFIHKELINYWITIWISTLSTCLFIYFSKLNTNLAKIVRLCQNTLLSPTHAPTRMCPSCSALPMLSYSSIYIDKKHSSCVHSFILTYLALTQLNNIPPKRPYYHPPMRSVPLRLPKNSHLYDPNTYLYNPNLLKLNNITYNDHFFPI